jgi:hypothetical protein
MKSELDRSKASFKLDLIETANADPMLSAADFKVLAAYVAVMAWPSCRSWLASSLAQAMTGISDRQFRESRKRLLGNNIDRRAYLIPVRQGGGKVSTYMLINPWRDEARALVDAKMAYHREVERQRKAGKRAALSRQNLQGQNGGCPGKICRSVPANSAAYYPSMITPSKKDSRGEDDQGAKVVKMADHKRRRA